MEVVEVGIGKPFASMAWACTCCLGTSFLCEFELLVCILNAASLIIWLLKQDCLPRKVNMAAGHVICGAGEREGV